MTYAIIRVGGKQYRVSEGQRLLVDRLAHDESKTFSPDVLFVGGDGDAAGATVSARVVRHVRGPKIRIGKHRRRTGYRRHTGFRSSLSEIEIETIGAKRARAPKAESKPEEQKPRGLPSGYEDMTVADISDGAKSWNRPMLEAALAYEREHSKRKGAIAALEAAIERKEQG
jgi:large subunit ribosomal protein L21